jgi:tetratricopeptide (TPR) repeat protein
MKSLRFLSWIFFASPLAAQTTGSNDYGLGTSSVMRFPRPSALFSNPAEIARLHQSEFLLSTNRFSNFSSMSASQFYPFVGTFGAGIARLDTITQYSVGYGGLIGHHTLGASLNLFDNAKEIFSLSVGTAFHFPDSASPNSGFHAGLSINNLPKQPSGSPLGLQAGIAYWLMNNGLRLQLGWQKATRGDLLIGSEVLATDWISLQIGSHGLKEIRGGLGVHSEYAKLEVAAGESGIAFSLSFRFGDAAEAMRSKYFESGMKAYDEKRLSEARDQFALALEYDEYYATAREMVNSTQAELDVNVAALFDEALKLEERKNYVEAIKRYQTILRMQPNHSKSEDRLETVKPILESNVQRLLLAGDSLRTRRDFERARRIYEQVLDLDPLNERVPERLAELESAVKENVQTIVNRGRTLMSRSQLDDAQKEFERVLTMEPRNADARRGLESIKVRRTQEIFEKGKSAFNDSNYWVALTTMLEVLERDDKHREARTYLDRSREALKPEVDKLFRSGVQLYIKEEYKASLDELTKILLIDPQHQGTLEYKRRAEEKLKALERLR